MQQRASFFSYHVYFFKYISIWQSQSPLLISLSPTFLNIAFSEVKKNCYGSLKNFIQWDAIWTCFMRCIKFWVTKYAGNFYKYRNNYRVEINDATRGVTQNKYPRLAIPLKQLGILPISSERDQKRLKRRLT